MRGSDEGEGVWAGQSSLVCDGGGSGRSHAEAWEDEAVGERHGGSQRECEVREWHASWQAGSDEQCTLKI